MHGQIHKHRGSGGHRLQRPSRAVPVLPLDVEPQAPAADLDRDDRPSGPGQPPERPEGLLGIGRPRQHARRSYPESAPPYQDGHAGYSDSIDEQTFLAQLDSTTCRGCRAGRALPRSSSTTTVTAGMTTKWGRSSPSRRHPLDALGSGPSAEQTPAQVPQRPTGALWGRHAAAAARHLPVQPGHNFVDSALTMQQPSVRFIEDNRPRQRANRQRAQVARDRRDAGQHAPVQAAERPAAVPRSEHRRARGRGRPRPRRPRTRRPWKAPTARQALPPGSDVLRPHIRTLRIQPRVGAVQGPSVVLSHSIDRGRSRGSTLWPPSNSR